MKKATLFSTLFLAAILFSAQAQRADVTSFSTTANDYDSNVEVLNVEMVVPEVIVIDLEDGTGQEINQLQFDFRKMTAELEAGQINFDEIVSDPIYLQYTSIVTDNTSDRNKIDVSFAGNIPAGVDLVLNVDPSFQNAPSNNGTPGTIRLSSMAFNATNTTATLVDDIASVFTGSGAQNGILMNYSLQQNGSFTDFEAGTYNSTITYTMTNM
ncbi:hypothetical protein [Leeuwenhoekiella palythoae]|uniref:CS1 type fimbrial major subunit n=1 Tax=Leeuwenhoekiella palythoae TaxID=573501 RepID=A0A1M5YAW4_9FLAO|nr:hypothetical protein [Leeuwenhoekiella palythoae]RXG30603.1 hypothetical protein DSM01_1354 [Leeuwenhoekiella palythoae]SHI09059.1 hypothetical protein SAMN04487999_2063 [Leeuwenhoekiella palythoae]